ncbi:MAG TPA: hypothetical protein VFZ01_01955, partial [Geminicoccaceae bacterium]
MLARSLDFDVPGPGAAAAPGVARPAPQPCSAAGRHGRQLSRNYALVAVASVLPFLLVVVVLA